MVEMAVPVSLFNLYNSNQKTFPNKSLDTSKKATNTVISVFVAFLVEHCLYRFLCTFDKSQCQHWFRRFQRMAASWGLLNKILHILNVVNPHYDDSLLITLCYLIEGRIQFT